MALTNNIMVKIASTLTGTVGKASCSGKVDESLIDTLTTSDALFTATGNISGTSDSFDLVGALTNPLGNGVTFATIQALYIKNTSSFAISIGGTNGIPLGAVGDIIYIPAGGEILLLGEYVVTAGTGDLLIINSLVAEWTAGTYTLNTYKRHGVKLFRVKVASTDKEPEVTSGWEDDWEEVSGESYEIVVIGEEP